MHRILILCSSLCLTPSVFAQQVTVEVWNLARQGNPPVPSSSAIVRAARAANLPPGVPAPPQRPADSVPQQNQYVLNATGLGPLVDVMIRQTDYHPWAVRDLYLAPGGDQNVNVQLFKYDYPIKAPECFALKTQYELLFRSEQRLTPNASRKEVEHRARLKYADGLLALPNPSRQEMQSPWVSQMLAEMDDNDRNELENMLDGLFDLYKMNGFEQYVPSAWQTTYISPNGPVESEVRLYGNHGTYSTGDGRLHTLDEIDIFYEENENGAGGFVIAGTWRFRDPSSSGSFRWLVDESEEAFSGTWQFAGRNERRSWTGRRLLQPPDGQPAPPAN